MNMRRNFIYIVLFYSYSNFSFKRMFLWPVLEKCVFYNHTVMSARPRPVTSKFVTLSAGNVKPRDYDLSSGGSTESLVSVLDHLSMDEQEAVGLSDDGETTKAKRGASARNLVRKVRRKRSETRRPRSSSAGSSKNRTYVR